ncbi:hypothetical protein ACJX0J_030530, partial [Zea mays]
MNSWHAHLMLTLVHNMVLLCGRFYIVIIELDSLLTEGAEGIAPIENSYFFLRISLFINLPDCQILVTFVAFSFLLQPNPFTYMMMILYIANENYRGSHDYIFITHFIKAFNKNMLASLIIYALIYQDEVEEMDKDHITLNKLNFIKSLFNINKRYYRVTYPGTIHPTKLEHWTIIYVLIFADDTPNNKFGKCTEELAIIEKGIIFPSLIAFMNQRNVILNIPGEQLVDLCFVTHMLSTQYLSIFIHCNITALSELMELLIV